MAALAGLLTLAATVQGAASPSAQVLPQTRRAIRIPVRSADPWFVKLMIEGQPLVSPELSTIFGLFGAPPGAAGAVNGLLSGGRLIVNPTDNSLWWYPD